MNRTIVLGTRTDTSRTTRDRSTSDLIGMSGSLELVSDAPELRQHLDALWLRDWVDEHLTTPAPASGTGAEERGTVQLSRVISLAESLFARHVLIGGATGSGKSRLIYHLLTQLFASGCSGIVFDPKSETLVHLAHCLMAMGLPPERLILISAQDDVTVGLPQSLVRINPFTLTSSPVQAASDLLSVLIPGGAAQGYRMFDTANNAAIIVAAHRLSPYELVRFLLNDAYREQLLSLPPAATDDVDSYQEAAAFFRDEFARMTPATKAATLGPVLNKLRGLLRGVLKPLLCAGEQTLDLSVLFAEQRVVLVHLNQAMLSDDGARLLGSLLINHIFRCAIRYGTNSAVPGVIVCMDELRSLQRHIGPYLLDMISVGRSYNLRIICACQHLDQLDAELRTALLANCAVQVFYRIAHEDARLVAKEIAMGQRTVTKRVRLDVAQRDRRTGRCQQTILRRSVLDAYGRPLTVSDAAWQTLRWDAMLMPPDQSVTAFQRLAAASGARRLYVARRAGAPPTALSAYLARAPHGAWWLSGRKPLQVAISVPTPKIVATETQTEADVCNIAARVLSSLPVQHAVLKTPTGPATLFRVTDISIPSKPTPALAAYLAAAVRANSQTQDEIRATKQRREQAVEEVASGATTRHDTPRNRPAPRDRGSEEATDGSIF